MSDSAADAAAAGISAQVAIVGGGIAGAWLGYRLAQRGVATVLLTDDKEVEPLSRVWAPGLMRQVVLAATAETAPEVFADISGTQEPGYQAMMVDRLRTEFVELTQLVQYGPIFEFMHPRITHPGIVLGTGNLVVSAVLERFSELGGRIVKGNCTDLVMDGTTCLGVRYRHGDRQGRIRCGELVLASGGCCGLFADGVGDNSGRMLGTYARHGGRLANLEWFNRFSLADLDRRRPLYPFDLAPGYRLLREGKPATELEQMLARFEGPECDREVFARYWSVNLDVPHTIELASGPTRLAPVKGFSMGGMAPAFGRGSAPVNIHTTGEAWYGLVVDSVTGKPFASFISRGAMLAEQLAERPTADLSEDFGPGPVAFEAPRSLRADLSTRLDQIKDHRFTVAGAQDVLTWCQQERQRRPAADTASIDLLILAEAYVRSVLARQESRGFFYRPDFPNTDPGYDGQLTVAAYDPGSRSIEVEFQPVDQRAVANRSN